MPKAIDLSEMRFGKLRVKEFAGHKGNKRMWLCECDCERQLVVAANDLLSGNTSSCGCGANKKTYKLSEMKQRSFGKLKVIGWGIETPSKFLCHCECGNDVEYSGNQLCSGHMRSCGCSQYDGLRATAKGKKIDLTGRKIGRWTVLSKAANTKSGGSLWLCQCSCEAKTIRAVNGGDLRSMKSLSCGCISAERFSTLNRTHGLSKSRLYIDYCNMKNRCYKESNERFADYGGRGIYIDEIWLEEHGFENLYKWAISNGYRDDLTLDRIDNNGPYAPWNCRWTTYKVQANNSRKNKMINYNGKSQSLAQWRDELNFDYSLVNQRLKHGWSTDRAFTLPSNRKNYICK